jgi:uncharacterized protein YwqG
VDLDVLLQTVRMRWWPKGKKEFESSSESPSAKASGESEFDYLTRLAGAHLPAEVASRWLGLLRPAIRLAPAASEDVVVARLGGVPRVPVDFVWPVWDGHGPLSFIGEVDLEAIDRLGLDLDVPLPSEGRLLAFYFDGSFDDFNGIVGTWDEDSLAGARLLHVADDTSECLEHPTPVGVPEFRSHDLTGRQVTTFPNWEHPVLRRAFGGHGQDHQEWMSHPVNAEPFADALWALHDNGPRHQIGGWADPVQGPVEYEVAQAALDGSFDYGDAAHTAEALRWSLLLQVDSDDASEMMWGDVGMLYWLCSEVSNKAGELAPVSFTWQCG